MTSNVSNVFKAEITEIFDESNFLISDSRVSKNRLACSNILINTVFLS